MTLTLSLLYLAACQPQEVDLPFETIERAGSGGTGEYYRGEQPKLVVITEAGKADVQLEGLVSQNALDQLAELDFQQYFAIAVFRRCQPSSGYDTIIERVARRGDKIVVYAQFWEPSPWYEVTGEVTSPYHLIKVRGDGGMIRETELILQSRAVTPTPPF